MWRGACAVTLLCAALARAAPHHGAEMSASPFVFARYGRSSQHHALMQRDRFHLVGRYGKRSYPAGQLDARLALELIETARGSDRDRAQGGSTREQYNTIGEWTRYAPYQKKLLRSYYKRAPEVVDVSTED